MTSIPADPGAIDLEAIKAELTEALERGANDPMSLHHRHLRWVFCTTSGSALIAAVEALRAERADPRLVLAWLNEEPRRRARDLPPGPEQNIAHLIEGQEELVKGGVEDDLIAVVASAVELAKVLAELLRWHRNEGDDTDEPPGEFLKKARAALDATTAEALERARAVEEFLRTVGLITVWSVPYEWVRGDRRITCSEIGPQTMFSADREAWERLQALDALGSVIAPSGKE